MSFPRKQNKHIEWSNHNKEVHEEDYTQKSQSSIMIMAMVKL